jgi:gamma-glutamylputrescine oxidase
MSGSTAWRDGEALVLPALDGEVEADVCVVGLGGSGLAAVLRLLELDQRVVAIDADCVAAGAAGRNGGFLLAGVASFYHEAIAMHGHERASGLYRRTLREIERMAEETPAAIRRVGSLRIAYDDEEFADCQLQLKALRADGFPVESYQGPEGQGLLLPSDGAFQPVARCHALARRARDGGAQLFELSPAVSIAGTEVRTPNGRVRCRGVIVAVDGRLERLLPELEGRVRSARLQMLATGPTTDVVLPRPVYTRWGYDYWQQLPDARVVVGGLRDQAQEAEWTDEDTPSQEVQAGLELMLRRRVGVRAPIAQRWAGVVGYTAAGLPVVAEARPGVWAIGGYNGTGNVIGAICGRGVAEQLVLGSSERLRELLP